MSAAAPLCRPSPWRFHAHAAIALAMCVVVPWRAGAQAARATRASIATAETAVVPSLAPFADARPSELAAVVSRYQSDRAALGRRYGVEYSPARTKRFEEFTGQWLARLRDLNFDRLSQEGRVDYVLLRNELEYEQYQLGRERRQLAEMQAYTPFAATIFDLMETRRRLEPINQQESGRTLSLLAKQIDSVRKGVEKSAAAKVDTTNAHIRDSLRTVRFVGFRTAGFVENLRTTLGQWYRYYSGYDPLFTWWAEDPYKKADESLKAYTKVLRERVVGIREGDTDPIIGDPIGAAGLAADLAHEMMPYTPERLIQIAEREYAWCETEMKKASREMGFGDDWRKALEKVKNTYVEPGKQPDLIRDLAREAEDFVEKRGLVTVPPLAKEIWRMEMMTPERQRVAPFFLGGETILVSYPTDGMTHEEKMMSMRGNNPHFSRATVHHELIPGHHLQGFMTDRYMPHRQVFSTPFWTEGWSLYWEMLLWDLGFPRTPEDRVGMLFWRMHRTARIIFSLRFHLGTMTPQEAVDFLVDRVGHERANAEAEVRRSFNGTYPPLYQVAYMIGGLQFRAMHRELVESGRMTNRQFHDAILQGGRMPVEIVRARIESLPLTRDYRAQWRFDDPPGR
jgi:uncharacterized protein (DUF885 family)